MLCQLLRFALGISLFAVSSHFVVKELLLLFLRAVAGYDHRQLIPISFLCCLQKLHERIIDAFIYFFTAGDLYQFWLIVFRDRVFIVYQHQVPVGIIIRCLRVLGCAFIQKASSRHQRCGCVVCLGIFRRSLVAKQCECISANSHNQNNCDNTSPGKAPAPLLLPPAMSSIGNRQHIFFHRIKPPF